MKKYIIISLMVILSLFFVGIIYYNIKRDNLDVNDSKDIVDVDDNIDDDFVDSDDSKLVFTIRSSRVNCYTNTLYVYSDNTYVYGNIRGNYEYDVDKIIDSVDIYEKNDRGPFILEYNNEKIELYDNNDVLNDFLKTINIYLDACASSYE